MKTQSSVGSNSVAGVRLSKPRTIVVIGPGVAQRRQVHPGVGVDTAAIALFEPGAGLTRPPVTSRRHAQDHEGADDDRRAAPAPTSSPRRFGAGAALRVSLEAPSSSASSCVDRRVARRRAHRETLRATTARPRGASGATSRSGCGFLCRRISITACGVRRLERRLAGDELVQHDPERVDVAALVGRIAFDLLRRHVRRRAEHRAARGHARVADRAREPEVGDADAALLVDEHVLRLEIAVDDALGVRGGEARGRPGGRSRARGRAASGRLAHDAPRGRRRRRTPSTGSASPSCSSRS